MIFNELIFEGNLSTISDFLKSNYNKIFNEPNQKMDMMFVNYTKKLDRDKNPSLIYQQFIKANQTLIQSEINNSESIDGINKIISDEIKYFYFSLKPVVNKLQNSEFTMEEIFSSSRDKNLQALMSYPEDKFSNAVTQYIDTIIDDIENDAGINEVELEDDSVGEMTERVKTKILKILEADDMSMDQNLSQYKQSTIKWFNTSLFELIRKKYQILNNIGSSTSNIVDQLSNEMEGTQNTEAKKMILNKILNMDKEELKNLAISVGISEEELGDL